TATVTNTPTITQTATSTAINTATTTQTSTVTQTASSTATAIFTSTATVTETPTVTPTPTDPDITTISPLFATVGASGVTLTVSGSGFTSGSVIHFGSVSLSTSFVSLNQLTAALSAPNVA